MDRKRAHLILEAFRLQNKVEVRLHRRTAEEVGFYGLTSHLDDGTYFVEVWQSTVEEMELTLLHEALHVLLWSRADEESDFAISHSFIYPLEENLKRIGWRMPAELHPVHGASVPIKGGKAARIIRGLLRLGVPLEAIPVEDLVRVVEATRSSHGSGKVAARINPRGKRFEKAVYYRLLDLLRAFPEVRIERNDRLDQRGIDFLLILTGENAKKLPRSRRRVAIDVKSDAPKARHLSHSVADREDPVTGEKLTAYAVRASLVGDWIPDEVWRSAVDGTARKILALASRVFRINLV